MTRKEQLARELCDMFEMSFSRPWEDMPPDTQAHWRECAGELIERMKQPGETP